jgi:hypothetical protein
MERFSLGERLRWVLRLQLVDHGVAMSAFLRGRSGYAGAAFQSELIFNGGVAERRPLPISASSN